MPFFRFKKLGFALFTFAAFSPLLIAPSASSQSPQGNAQPQTMCKYSAGSHNDGCLDSPGGTFLNENFFGSGPGAARQSGQNPYRNALGKRDPHPITWSQCGIDYPCGVISDDAHLMDIKVAQISGCLPYNPRSNIVQCDTEKWRGNGQVSGNLFHINSTTSGTMAVGLSLNFFCNPAGNSGCGASPQIVSGSGSDWAISGPPLSVPARTVVGLNNISISGYRINDVLIYLTGLGGLTLMNNHATVGLNTCRNTGGPMISGGAGDQTYLSNTWDHDSSCNGAANLFKTKNDPGLPTIAYFTASIADGVLTVINNTGTLARGQYIDFPNKPTTLQIYSTSESTLYSCKDAACDGHTFLVARAPCDPGRGAYACRTDTSLNQTSTAMTAGPVQMTTGFDAAGGGGWAKATIKYNVSLGLTAIGKSSSGGPVDYQFNYCDIVAWFPEHANCFLQQSAPGQVTRIDHYNNEYSVALIESLSAAGQGTSLASLFATSPQAGAAGGYQISYTYGKFDHLILVSNNSINPSGKTMGYNARTLNQGSNPQVRGHITNMLWDNIYSDATGSYGHCYADPNSKIDNDKSTNNVDLLTGSSFGC